MSSSISKTVTNHTKYYIDEILDERVNNGIVEYLVKWKNYGKHTWEPKHHLLRFKCEPFIQLYERLSTDQKNKLMTNDASMSAITDRCKHELCLNSENNESRIQSITERKRTKTRSYDVSDLQTYGPPLDLPVGVTQYYGSYPHRYWNMTNTKWYACECGVKGNFHKLCGHFGKSRSLNAFRHSTDLSHDYNNYERNCEQIERNISLGAHKCCDHNKFNKAIDNSIPNECMFFLIGILMVIIITAFLLFIDSSIHYLF